MANEPTNPEYIPMVEHWQLDAGKQIFTLGLEWASAFIALW